MDVELFLWASCVCTWPHQAGNTDSAECSWAICYMMDGQTVIKMVEDGSGFVAKTVDYSHHPHLHKFCIM